MVDQVLLLFQALFLVLLYLFIWRIVRTASRDLRLPQESFVLTPAQLAGTPLAAPPRRRLVVEASPAIAIGSAFDLGSAPVTIGRGDETAIALPGDEFASSRHARVEAMRDGVWVVDLGSRNGTFVNGGRVDGRERLHEGDVVRVGATELRLAS
jgi:pSer/pThr/pTyr-binding forkhead associated (FHA) protein